mmetsp:Transcript_7429/g.16285  ORF Transcript_7429/g.16285 Transcript_7429/m.16285 type:complete len:226 (-) Transcript_7429:12-689(-)
MTKPSIAPPLLRCSGSSTSSCSAASSSACASSSSSSFSACFAFICILLIDADEPPYLKPWPAYALSSAISARRSSTVRAKAFCCSARRFAHVEYEPCDCVSRLATPETWRMSPQTSSRKKRSWLTTTMIRSSQVGLDLSSRVSQSTAPIERWLVGSSSSSMSGLPKIAAASAVRTRQPPERADMGRRRSSSEKPRLTSNASARVCTVSTSSCCSWSITPPGPCRR